MHYRKWVNKDYLIGEAHAKSTIRITNITPFAQIYYQWWRMPDIEFEMSYLFTPFFMIGQLDTSKEIHIPRKKDGIQGYDVLSPLYCYEGGRVNLAEVMRGGEPVTLDKAAIVINRGWIPEELKDKTRRIRDINSNKLTKIVGMWRKGKGLHDYRIPNNPDNNEWHNI